MSIVLGSSSKWRRGLLAELLGVAEDTILTMPPDIDEKAVGDRSVGASPAELVVAVARAKAAALRRGGGVAPGAVVLCLDQVVVCGGAVREKPADAAEARAFVEAYRHGAAAETVTGVVAFVGGTAAEAVRVATARVSFGGLSEEAAADYLATNKDLWYCCGALVVEAPQLARVAVFEQGTLDSVQGFPKAEVAQVLAELGVEVGTAVA